MFYIWNINTICGFVVCVMEKVKSVNTKCLEASHWLIAAGHKGNGVGIKTTMEVMMCMSSFSLGQRVYPKSLVHVSPWGPRSA